MPLILDGKKAAATIRARLRKQIASLTEKPALAIIQVGRREESTAYIERKKAFGKSVGAFVRHIQLPESVSEAEVIRQIDVLNADGGVCGIIVQLPLPAHFDRTKIQNVVAPKKDIDGLGAGSQFTPATARGIVELLEFYQIPIRGRRIAVLGRSALVGTPTAEALRNAGAEVAVCHSETPNTKEITRGSDMVVVAIGKPRLIGAEYFRSDETQTVVDVGITAVTEKGEERLEEELPRRTLVGDVDFGAVKNMVAAISPVPGGVGPMTVASLFENLVSAYEKQTSLSRLS